MRIAQILFSQGFGSRRECAALLAQGQVQVAGLTVTEADADFDTGLGTGSLVVTVAGRPWPCHSRALLLLHKPAACECSRQPQHHPSVLSLLPPPLRQRGVQPVGRLDQDTTGVLLLTDNGTLIHRLTAPKHHVEKVYEVGTRHPVDQTQVAALLAGVLLHDDATPARAVACKISGECSLQLTLTEGRYHQVKRMLAAVGNRVESLHRSAFGPWSLPPGLAPGQWCWLDASAALLACQAPARCA